MNALTTQICGFSGKNHKVLIVLFEKIKSMILIFKIHRNSGYYRLYFFKQQYQNSFQLKMYPFICTFHIRRLDFVIFPENPQICVVNVFIDIELNFHFYFPGVLSL